MKFLNLLKRKTVITGHYGSGKTEFSVSLAMLLAGAHEPFWHGSKENPQSKVSLIDLDIVNPYFRSRERRKMLENAGISVYGCIFDEEVTAELPALAAAVRAPLEDGDGTVIADLGGNNSGALIINQFAKYFTGNDTSAAAVVNFNRPDTGTVRKAVEHITAIETATGLTVSYIINNTHLLRETTADDVIKGHTMCMEICAGSGKNLLCDCYPDGIVDAKTLAGISENLMPMGLYMRPSWLDK